MQDKTKLKIVSGGQTGVDRAALDVGLQLQLEIGGWCPAGRKAENGRIPARYPLQEHSKSSYKDRTRQNVIDSDGTLIIFFSSISGGTKLTRDCCIMIGKPFLLINAETTDPLSGSKETCRFINLHDIKVLNVAGPRASEEGRAYGYTTNLLLQLFAIKH